jgi:hypothetical protein
VPFLSVRPVTLVSFTPPSGTGVAGQFTVKFRRNGPASQFSNVSVLFNADLDGRDACWVGYDPAAHRLYLVGDDGGTLLAPITPGTAANRQNGQCTILGQGSSAAISGADLTLTLRIDFHKAFRHHIAHTAAIAPGESSGWVSAGSWSAP